MEIITNLIESGLLELYVLGLTDAEETSKVENLASLHKEVQQEIQAIEKTLEINAFENAVEPGVAVKPLFLATVDFIERIEQGEHILQPPLLHPGSKISDYDLWLNRDDMYLPKDYDGLYAKIISASPEATTLIAWLKEMAPEEVHNKEYERFLIVEGTCTITVENDINYLSPGDFFAIPLHKPHEVKVTSNIPCKVILQRVAV